MTGPERSGPAASLGPKHMRMIRHLLFTAAGMAERACLWLAAVAAVYMMAVVAFNVVARLLFDLSGARVNLMIRAAIEQSSLALLVMVMAALAAAIRDGMIGVDLLVHRMPGIVRRNAARLWYLMALVLAVVLARAFAHEATVLAARGDVTQDMGLPLWIFHAVITVECVALALVSLDAAVTGEKAGEGQLS